MLAEGSPRIEVLTSCNSFCPLPQTAHASHCRSEPRQSAWLCSWLKAGERLGRLCSHVSIFQDLLANHDPDKIQDFFPNPRLKPVAKVDGSPHTAPSPAKSRDDPRCDVCRHQPRIRDAD